MTEQDDRSREFLARRERCDEVLPGVMDFIEAAAKNAGAQVDQPKFVKRGGGVTYWTGGHRFCRFDPKFGKSHVAAIVFPPADPVQLDRVGLKHTREGKDGPWIWIANMRDAVRLVPFILCAHDTFTPPISN
jgi:hypothetical protein